MTNVAVAIEKIVGRMELKDVGEKESRWW